MKTSWFTFLGVLLCLVSAAQVRIDEGTQMINGIWLLPHVDNPLEFYYIPQYPRIAINKEGKPEFLLLKYNQGGANKGGIIHALFEFTLFDDEIKTLESGLKKRVPKARIAGPVPLFNNDQVNQSTFSLVSSVLNADNKLATKVQTSGKVSVTPGSKAAIAAALTADGISLFESSLKSSTTDLSVVLNTSFVGHIKSYNARVHAKTEMLYSCFKEYSHKSLFFSTKQVQKIIDSLYRKSVITIEVNNHGLAYGDNAAEMDKLLSMFTNKVLEVMFDAKDGWAKDPDRIIMKQADIAPPKIKMGFLGKIFGGVDNVYLPSSIYSMKTESQVSISEITLDMNKSISIKVPIVAAGNISALSNVPEFEKCMKGVFADDNRFETRDIYFQVNPDYWDSFDTVVSHVQLEIADWKGNITGRTFTAKEFSAGNTRMSVTLIKENEAGNRWQTYKYRVTWHRKGTPVAQCYPLSADSNWIETNLNFVELSPPFVKKILFIHLQKDSVGQLPYYVTFELLAFKDPKVDPAPKLLRQFVVKMLDTETEFRKSVWVDLGESLAYRVKFKQNNEQKLKASIITTANTAISEELVDIKIP